MKKKITRRDVQKLKPEIIAKFHRAGQNGDVEEYKRLLGEYAAHVPSDVKERLIQEFRQNVSALRAARREE